MRNINLPLEKALFPKRKLSELFNKNMGYYITSGMPLTFKLRPYVFWKTEFCYILSKILETVKKVMAEQWIHSSW